MMRLGLLFLLSFSALRVNAGLADPIVDAASDAVGMVSAPASFSRAQAYTAAGVLCAGALAYSLDGQVRHVASKNRSASLDDISRQTEKLGNGGYDAAILGAFAGAGYLLKDRKLTRTSYLAFESFLAGNAVGVLGKYSIGRARPYAGLGKKAFKPFAFKTARASFPSGHTISAFSIATVFAKRYNGFAVSAAAYGLASAVGLQRIYADKHWTSDVLLGAAIGYAAGTTVVNAESRKPAQSAYFIPVYAPGYGGILLAAGF